MIKVIYVFQVTVKQNLHYFLPKICYDNPGNVPNKGRNFNTQKFGKM